MTSGIQGAESRRAEFEERLATTLSSILSQCEVPGPWVAVAIAYAHGLDFHAVVGVLTSDEWRALNDPGETAEQRLNPAEWVNYDDAPLLLVDARLEELGRELEALVGDVVDDIPRYARHIYTRVATRLRATLVAHGCLEENGLVFATEYGLCDLRENATKANPASALQRFYLD